MMPAAPYDDATSGERDATNGSAARRNVSVTGNRIDSRELFSTDRELIISHNEGDYRLRLTSQNKLILTK